MLSAVGMFLLGVFLLLLGGDSAVRGTCGLSRGLGLAPARAGLLSLLVATLLPPLAVNAYAFGHGQSMLALGNAIGGHIAGIGLTLGLAAMTAPLALSMRLLPALAMFVLVAIGAVLLLGIEDGIARWQGGVLAAAFVVVLVWAFVRGREEAAEAQKTLAQYAETATGLNQNLVRLLIAAAVLYFGGRLTVENAAMLGQALGISPMLAGMTVLAIGTALPVTAMAMLAARQGQGDLVVVQVLAACLFNLLLVVGGLAAMAELPMPAAIVGRILPAAMAFAVVLYLIVARGRPAARREGGLLLAMFGAWLAFALVAGGF